MSNEIFWTYDINSINAIFNEKFPGFKFKCSWDSSEIHLPQIEDYFCIHMQAIVILSLDVNYPN